MSVGEDVVSDTTDKAGPGQRFTMWRESIRRRPRAYLIYRIVIGVLGGGIVIGGLALVPLPGPGWVIVLLGLAILATEFTWAKRVEQFARRQVNRWTDWLKKQSWPVRGLVGLGTAVLVVAILYAVFAVLGLPEWVPLGWLPEGLPYLTD